MSYKIETIEITSEDFERFYQAQFTQAAAPAQSPPPPSTVPDQYTGCELCDPAQASGRQAGGQRAADYKGGLGCVPALVLFALAAGLLILLFMAQA